MGTRGGETQDTERQSLTTTCAQCTFLNIKPKMHFNVTIDEDCMIFKCTISVPGVYLQ